MKNYCFCVINPFLRDQKLDLFNIVFRRLKQRIEVLLNNELQFGFRSFQRLRSFGIGKWLQNTPSLPLCCVDFEGGDLAV